MEDIIIRFLTPEMLAVILGFIFTFMVRRKWIGEKHAAVLNESVDAAVISVYHEYVKEIKSDRKLTEEEKKEARARAIAKIKERGMNEGIDLLKEYGIDYVVSLIERKVRG